MVKFEDASRRLLGKLICMRCSARNPIGATKCRRCKSTRLRKKAKESRGA